MKVGLGLGLERLGLIALARPKIMGALVLTLTIVLVVFLPGLRFQGDLLEQADRQSDAWREYEEVQADFALAQPQIYFLVEPPNQDMSIQTWLEIQNGLVLNLRLTPGVSDVQSLFSLRRAGDRGATLPLIAPGQLPSSIVDLRALADERPDVAVFLNPDGPVARIAIVLEQESTGDADFPNAAVVERVTDMARTSGLSVQISGGAVIQREISDTLLRDLVRMVAFSTLVGWIMGFLIFSNVRAVLITNIISPAAMFWTAGFAAMTGQTLNSITVVLPILASIIAFADAVHLVVPLSKKLDEGEPLRAALGSVLRRVGPATALTSMTTALAFGSLSLAGGPMVNVALLGVVAVVLAWLAVITLTPLLCLLIARGGLGEARFNSARFQARFRALAGMTLTRGRMIVACSALLGVALLFVASRMQSEHSPSDYLPQSSEARMAEAGLERFFSGSLSILVSMPLAIPNDPLHPENRTRLNIWQQAIEHASDGGFVWSRARLPEGLVAQFPDKTPDLSEAGDRFLIMISHGWEETGTQSLARVEELRAALETLPGGEGVQIASTSTIVASKVLEDINRLRTGLFLSVTLAAGLVALLSRSLTAGAAVGLSVLLSSLVLLVGSAMWSGTVSYGLIVALIISVGIAIDDGIHLVNAARAPNGSGPITPAAWTEAIARTGGAVLVTSLILIATLAVTQVSSMPALREIGREVALALAVALVFTLTIIAPTAVFLDQLKSAILRRNPR